VHNFPKKLIVNISYFDNNQYQKEDY